MKWLAYLIVCFSTAFLMASEQDLLKLDDVNKIMKQILEHHVQKKEVTGQLLQTAFKNYIDQFDPYRIYLLDHEVKPFLAPSQEQLEHLIKQYQNQDFSQFNRLNDLIQNSIKRSREMRPAIEEEAKKTLFSVKREEMPSKEKIEYGSFAKNIDELKSHILILLENFVQIQKKRFSGTIVGKRKDETMQAFDTRLQEFENQYLYEDEHGKLLNQSEQENLFVIHILKALARSLDSHTSFYQAGEAYDMRVRLQKEFQGIGIILKDSEEGIVVASLLEGAPAANSGLIKPDDILLEVNGKSARDYPFDKIMEFLHDSKEREVKLLFKRKGEAGETDKVFSVSLMRAAIVLNNDRVDVSSENFGNGIIGKITLHSFYQGDDVSSEKDVKEAIQKLQGKGPLKGLILDLRDNSGGFLSQAVKVAGLFITSGVIVISKYSNGEEKIYRDVDSKVLYDGPLVVLTSKATASAAEIVAQAIQDYGVGIVIGDEHTYGKGTIQTQTITDNQGSSFFKVTVGKYYTVSGKTPQKEGVKADIIVPSRLNAEPIGEEFIETAEKSDRIPSSFDDSLNDISADVKSWYIKYYVPKLQNPKSEWRNLIPTLKKNSTHRIANNKNYQFYLKGVKSTEESEEEEGEGEEDETLSFGKRKKDFGESDLQMDEAVNIVKDMVLLHSLEPDRN